MKTRRGGDAEGGGEQRGGGEAGGGGGGGGGRGGGERGRGAERRGRRAEGGRGRGGGAGERKEGGLEVAGVGEVFDVGLFRSFGCGDDEWVARLCTGGGV